MNFDDNYAVIEQAAKCPCFRCRHRQGCEIECNDYQHYVNPYPAMQGARKHRKKAFEVQFEQ